MVLHGQDLTSSYYNSNVCIKAYTTRGGSPSANFVGTPAEGIVPLTVNFIDSSTGNPTSWAWDVNGDGVTDFTTRNCSYTYNNPGQYSVKLTVSNNFGSDEEIKTNYVKGIVAPPFLSGWSYRKLHTLSGSTTDLTNYQIRFKVYNTTGTDSGENVYLGSNVKPDFSDLMFTTTDNTLMPYWIQETGTNYAIVWVKVPSIPTSGTQMYLYYGNPIATSQSNGDATFLFFDDFGGSSLNTSKWSPSLIPYSGGTGTVSISGGILSLTSTNNKGVSLRSQNPIPVGTGSYRIGQSIQILSGGTYAQYRTVLTDASNADPGTNNGIFFYGNTLLFQVNAVSGQTSQPFIHQANYDWTVAQNAYLNRNGVQTVSLSNPAPSLPDQNRYLRFWVYNSAAVKSDWVFVAKAASTEPIHSLWAVADYNPSPPIADFSANSTSAPNSITVQFSDHSSGNPEHWDWNFGDATGNTSSQNPVHSYSTPGSYNVTLTVWNDIGKTSVRKNNFIIVTTPPPLLSGSVLPETAYHFRVDLRSYRLPDTVQGLQHHRHRFG